MLVLTSVPEFLGLIFILGDGPFMQQINYRVNIKFFNDHKIDLKWTISRDAGFEYPFHNYSFREDDLYFGCHYCYQPKNSPLGGLM